MTSIVDAAHFIQATRDTGYRSLSFAVAELIDNAIDAGASAIDVTVSEEKTGRVRDVTIAVLDNGSGMDKATLWNALRFGGTARFDLRDSLGRYGMGLPNGSVSQAQRVDVYSWTKGRRPLWSYLDVDEIAGEAAARGVPQPVLRSLPTQFARRPASGTLVCWSRCDRLEFKKASTIVRRLRPALGRIYRLLITDELAIRLNGIPIEAVDPLFRAPTRGLPGTSTPYGDPLEYRIRTAAGNISRLTVQFVELPVARWHSLSPETKRTEGIVGGAGLSVLRGGREIDYGWHLFGGKRRENYDDWWRAELRFEPALDELVGITHSKQGIRPTRDLREVVEPDLEQVARTLNTRVRQAFEQVRGQHARLAETRASKRDRLLPKPQAAGRLARRPTGDGFRFRIGEHGEPRREFFRTQLRGSELDIEINRNHPFYRKLYGDRLPASAALDVLLVAAARALLDLPEDARQTLVRSWSDNLLAFLG